MGREAEGLPLSPTLIVPKLAERERGLVREAMSVGLLQNHSRFGDPTPSLALIVPKPAEREGGLVRGAMSVGHFQNHSRFGDPTPSLALPLSTWGGD